MRSPFQRLKVRTGYPAGRSTWLPAALAAALVLAMPLPGGGNPLSESDVADPSILQVGDTLYAYSTSSCLGRGGYRIHRAHINRRDDWTSVGRIFSEETRPDWMARTCRFWAPEVHFIGGRYICYFSVPERETRQFAIGAAIAESPLGPFRDVGRPLAVHRRYGLIDASAFVDPLTSRTFVLYKEDKNDLSPQEPTGLILLEVERDGVTPKGKEQVLLINDCPWEGCLVEAPTLIYRDSYYYLFFSGNVFNDERYGIGVARSKRVEGPYEKWKGNPILRSSDRFNGPGHQFLFPEPDGSWTMFYHARDQQGGGYTRYLMADPVRWNEEGWPYINRGRIPSARDEGN